MKEKRYFCDWWNNRTSKYNLIAVILSVCVAFVLFLAFDGFSVPDYPEGTYKELEVIYLPYVHEGIGVDSVGLKKVLDELEPTVTDKGELLSLEKSDCKVLVMLDENYKTVSVERDFEAGNEYVRAQVVRNIALFVHCILGVWLIYFAIALCLSLISDAHKWIDQKICKRKN